MPQSHIQEGYLEEVEFRPGPEWKRYAASKEGLGRVGEPAPGIRCSLSRDKEGGS